MRRFLRDDERIYFEDIKEVVKLENGQSHMIDYFKSESFRVSLNQYLLKHPELRVNAKYMSVRISKDKVLFYRTDYSKKLGEQDDNRIPGADSKVDGFGVDSHSIYSGHVEQCQ